MGSKFVDECLKAHNDYRKKHGVPVLKHNKEMTSLAQKWADHLAMSGTFQHSTNRELKGERLGENIAMKWTSSGEDFTGGQVTEQWYDEIKKYSFRSHNGAGTASRPGLFGSLFGKKADSKHTTVVRETNKTGVSTGPLSGYRGNSTNVSRKVTTQTVNGKTVTKTVITETTLGPDGRKTVNTREEVTEGESHTGLRGGQSSHMGTDRDFRRRFEELSFDSPHSSQQRESPSTHHAHIRNTSNNNAPATKEYRTYYASGDRGASPNNTEKEPQKMKDFVKDVIKTHNVYRQKHGKVGDLKSNSSLNDKAQAWAENLAAVGTLSHSDGNYNGDQMGENVAYKWASTGADYTGQEVTDQWYSEVEKYDFNRNDFKPGTGHFTQIVWKGSKEIGVGKAHAKNGAVYVVCNYFPAGNMVRHFSDNVFPAKHK